MVQLVDNPFEIFASPHPFSKNMYPSMTERQRSAHVSSQDRANPVVMVHVLDMITRCPADTLPKLAPAQACIDNASNKSEESTSFIRLVSTTFLKACQKLLQGCFLLFLTHTHTGETATRSRNMCVCVTVTPLPKSVNLSLSHSNISLLS